MKTMSTGSSAYHLFRSRSHDAPTPTRFAHRIIFSDLAESLFAGYPLCGCSQFGQQIYIPPIETSAEEREPWWEAGSFKGIPKRFQEVACLEFLLLPVRFTNSKATLFFGSVCYKVPKTSRLRGTKTAFLSPKRYHEYYVLFIWKTSLGRVLGTFHLTKHSGLNFQNAQVHINIFG